MISLDAFENIWDDASFCNCHCMAKNQLAAWKGVLDQDSAWHSVICTVWALLEEVAVAEWINHSANLPSPAVHLAIGPCLGLGTEHSHMAILGLIQEYNLYIYYMNIWLLPKMEGEGQMRGKWWLTMGFRGTLILKLLGKPIFPNCIQL